MADHTNHRRINVLDVIATADCLQSRGIPRSLIHMNKQPDRRRVGRVPVKKASLVSATTYPSFIVFGKKMPTGSLNLPDTFSILFFHLSENAQQLASEDNSNILFSFEFEIQLRS